MACILKKKYKDTIHSILRRYLISIFTGALLINGITLFYYFYSKTQYEAILDENDNLNRFFDQIENTNSLLDQYVQRAREEDGADLEKDAEALTMLINRLSKAKVNRAFSRDISDMAALVEGYQKQIIRIREMLGQEFSGTGVRIQEQYFRVQSVYKESQEQYQLIDREFRNLHYSLLEQARLSREKLRRREWIYFGEYLVLFLVFIAVSIRKASMLSSRITDPLTTLTDCAQKINDGQAEKFVALEIPEEAAEETMILMHSFNLMMDTLQERIRMIEENTRTKVALQEQQLRLRTSELRALQMQINPHFLFNTLNMISKTAYMEERDKTVSLLQCCAQLFRYCLDYVERSAPLEKELEMLGNYVSLQEQRFGSRILFDFDLDERFHGIQVPSLILQPLVENSIVHGVGTCVEGAEILVTTRFFEEEGKGMISVKDNGDGMTPEQLARICEEIKTDTFQSDRIGLANVAWRLRLFFNGRSEMKVLSSPGEGTEIKIYLPVRRKDLE